MTEGEWMGDRWSMMLSLKKKTKKKKKKKKELTKKRRRKCFSSFPFLSLFHLLSEENENERESEREKEKSKSYPLHLKQINLISSLIFFSSSLLYT